MGWTRGGVAKEGGMRRGVGSKKAVCLRHMNARHFRGWSDDREKNRNEGRGPLSVLLEARWVLKDVDQKNYLITRSPRIDLVWVVLSDYTSSPLASLPERRAHEVPFRHFRQCVCPPNFVHGQLSAQ